MINVPFGPNGQPLTPIEPPRPTLFTGTVLWVFDNLDEYAAWLLANQPIPPTPSPPETETTEP